MSNELSDYDVLSMYGVLVSDAEVWEWLRDNLFDNLTGDELEVAKVKARVYLVESGWVKTTGTNERT